MKVLIACEFSGIVREAFRKKGHNAWSCDLLDTEIPGQHFKGDISEFLWPVPQWDLIIAHPPCTRLCNSGVRWLKEKNLWAEMRQAADFFNLFCNIHGAFPDTKVAVENPIPHKHADLYKYNQIIQPWQFGHGEIKATCLWLYGLPELQSTNIVTGREGRVWKETPGPDRWKNRSRTYQGIADAMANQWG